MKKEQNRPVEAAELRSHAEKHLTANLPDPDLSLMDHEAQRIFHELQVHQIELEMQNAELLRNQEELEESRNRYTELYDFAPVGYFTFDVRGIILEVNLAGAELLGFERRRLVNTPFTGLIQKEADREIFVNHLALALMRKVILRCEIELTNSSGVNIHFQLQSIAITSAKESGYILTSVVDGTIRKHLEDALQSAHDKLEQTVAERTEELTRTNLQLRYEIEEHRKAEESLQNALEEIKMLQDQLQAENVYLQQEVAREYNFGEIIGNSNAISYVFFRIEQVAPQDATVLLLGETGTGKGVVARAIHSRSARKDRPMITVNCTSLPANLIESELFGREKGAFTGANARQIGRFELANGGTIFLDEIGEMPLELQSKLLRVIQDGEFERLGNPRTIKVDVRIIAASNRKLEDEINAGRFREDLFYRLNVFPITIPPLRQRREDIPLLVNHFVAKFNKKVGKKIDTIPKETLHALQEYHWPGNVRELESVIERAVITSRDNVLKVLDRFDTFRKEGEPAAGDVKALADLEQNHILQVLQKTGWRIEGKTGAAILLGINPSTLRARMRKYGIRRQ